MAKSERPKPDVQPMKTKEYRRELRRLHGELVAMQEWVKATGAKICVVFEGRDTAGKGGTIKAITDRVSPRVFRVVALPAPTEREKSQMYVQRYIPHFPAAGEVVIFDRSWYNRAGVERVMGFCTEDEARRFLDQVPAVEKAMIDSGILLLKYWLEVGPEQQTLRLESRIDDPRKIWKLSDMDLKSYTRWDDYSRARDEMFAASDTPWAPWYVAHTDDKNRARLNVITHLLEPGPVQATEAKEGGAARARRERRRLVARDTRAGDPHTVLRGSAGARPLQAEDLRFRVRIRHDRHSRQSAIRAGRTWVARPSTEGETQGPGAGIEELDLELPVLDRAMLSDELVEPARR